MQQPHQPGKILRWVKASERLPEADRQVCGRSLGRYLSLEFPTNEDIRAGKITCANMEVLEEWYPELEWLEETEDLSAPASPVEESPELNVTDPETSDERTYRKESEWHLKQLRECQEKLNQKEMEFTQLLAEFKTMQSRLPESKSSLVIEIGEEKGENSWDQTPKQAANFFVKYGPKVKLLTEARYQAFLAGVDWSRSLTNPPASHPATALIVGERGERIRVNLLNRAMATVSPDASPELLNALTKMVDLAKAMPDALTEQALPEEIVEWIESEVFSKFPDKYDCDIHAMTLERQRQAGRTMALCVYRKMKDELGKISLEWFKEKEKADKFEYELGQALNKLAAANDLIKEKQEWINSHI